MTKSSKLSNLSVLTTLGLRTRTDSAAAHCAPVTPDHNVCRGHMFEVLDCVKNRRFENTANSLEL